MTPISKHRLGAAARVALLALLALSVTACDALDRLLSVRSPTQVLATDLDDPVHADFLVNSMISTFHCAFGAYIVATNEISDILSNTASQVGRSRFDARQLDSGFGHISNYGQGACDALENIGVYRPLQETRWFADDLLDKLENRWDAAAIGQNRNLLIAQAAVHGGYATLLLGEGFCSMTFDGGVEVTRDATFDRAIARFTRGIEAAQAAGANDLLNAARVGRARAHRNRNNLNAARQDALLVPPGFAFRTRHENAPNYRRNIVAWQTAELFQGSVNEPYRAPTWQGVRDPRIGARLVTSPRTTWVQEKYANSTTPLPIARYAEAQLIIAEAELEAGNHPETVRIINVLHTAAGIPAFASSDPAEIRAHLIRERTHELFLESHRLADMLRYNLPFLPVTGTPYTGSGGGEYGPTTCMVLPPVEYNNNANIQR